MKKTNNSELCC